MVVTGQSKGFAMTALARKTYGAGDGNRTRVLSLGSRGLTVICFLKTLGEG
jgi:hypothetical protein